MAVFSENTPSLQTETRPRTHNIQVESFRESPKAATLGSQMAKKKVTFKVALFGALGSAGLAYAFLRRPRHLYDGEVQVCEGSSPLIGIDQACNELAMRRGSGSGKILAPFNGTVSMAANVGGKQAMVIRDDNSPAGFHFTLDRGTTSAQAGGKFKAGDVIGQAERVKVSAFRDEGDKQAPVPPSSWLVANALVPASKRGSQWCEDSYQQVVPSCPGVDFRAPELPKWSLRTVRMKIQ